MQTLRERALAAVAASEQAARERAEREDQQEYIDTMDAANTCIRRYLLPSEEGVKIILSKEVAAWPVSYEAHFEIDGIPFFATASQRNGPCLFVLHDPCPKCKHRRFTLISVGTTHDALLTLGAALSEGFTPSHGCPEEY